MHILATASIKMSGLPDRNSADHISNSFCQEDSKGLCWKMQIPPPQSLRILEKEDQNKCTGKGDGEHQETRPCESTEQW